MLDAHQVVQQRVRSVKIDGMFGPLTESGIRRFQSDAVGLLHPDGIISPNGRTWRRLILSDYMSQPRGSKANQPNPTTELNYLAKTLYGEASGQNHASKIAVAWSIRNRLESGRWGHSYQAVVTARLQYTCWSQTADPNNFARIQHPQGRAWDDCLSVANEVIHALSRDNPIPGATHYYSPNSQVALHRLNRKLYPELPTFSLAPAQLVNNPPGVSNADFRFYSNVR